MTSSFEEILCLRGTLLASQCCKIKRKSRYQGTRFILRIKIIHLCVLFAKHAQKFYCLTQRHRWRPRVSCLWGDRDDHMETTNRPSRPDRLEIFWNDWAIGTIIWKPGYKKLIPSKDEHGLLRAHGRLENIRTLPDEMRNPVILPKSHRLVEL